MPVVPTPTRSHDRGGAGTIHTKLSLEDETRLVREFFGTHPGFFVEVGANDPEEHSQTLHLEQRGWTGILIEPQPDMADKLRRERKARVFAVACSSPEHSGRTLPLTLADKFSSLNAEMPVATARARGSIEVPIMTLDQVLMDAQAPTPIDFLSVDVEGHEIEVMHGFDFQRWRPRLILVEDHVLDRRLHEAITARGYTWICRTGLNSWYVPAAGAPRVDWLGRLAFFRKYYLGVPPRRLRQALRRLRLRLGLIRDPS